MWVVGKTLVNHPVLHHRFELIQFVDLMNTKAEEFPSAAQAFNVEERTLWR